MLGIDVHNFDGGGEGTKPTILCALGRRDYLVDYRRKNLATLRTA